MSNDITITLPEFAIAATAGIAFGWAWTESGFFRPIRWYLHGWFPEKDQDDWTLKGWVAYGIRCPVCTGFYVQAALILESISWSLWVIPIALAAVFVHLVWLQIVLTLTAIQLR